MGKRRIRLGRLFVTFITFLTVIGVVVLAGWVSLKDMGAALPNAAVNAIPEIKTEKVPLSSVNVSNDLILVNTSNMLDTNKISGIVDAYGTVSLSVKELKMHKDTLSAVKKMFDAAIADGHTKFFVNSGYRTKAKQEKLYNNAEDKSFVQKPGASEHQTGYALDIAFSGLTNEQFEKSDQFKWMKKNAWKYGFILRYPKDKTKITGISYEPWHYRYVGVPHAYYCYKNDLCLEEYLDSLLKNKSYSIKIGETNYTVYYTTAKDGYIELPKNGLYSVSSDNRNGYIVTVKG